MGQGGFGVEEGELAQGGHSVLSGQSKCQHMESLTAPARYCMGGAALKRNITLPSVLLK